MSIFSIALELAAVVGILLSFVLVIKSWRDLPSEIPIHFGFSGEPDGWGPKSFAVILPVVNLIMWAGFTLLNRIPGTPVDPVMNWVLLVSKVDIIWMFTYITWKMIQTALKQAEGLGKLFLPVSLLPLGLIVAGLFIASAMQHNP